MVSDKLSGCELILMFTVYEVSFDWDNNQCSKFISVTLALAHEKLIFKENANSNQFTPLLFFPFSVYLPN